MSHEKMKTTELGGEISMWWAKSWNRVKVAAKTWSGPVSIFQCLIAT